MAVLRLSPSLVVVRAKSRFDKLSGHRAKPNGAKGEPKSSDLFVHILDESDRADEYDIGYSRMRPMFSKDNSGTVFDPPRSWIVIHRADGLGNVRNESRSTLRTLGAKAVEPLITAMNSVDRDKEQAKALQVHWILLGIDLPF